MDGKRIQDIVGSMSRVDVENRAPGALSVMAQNENNTRCEGGWSLPTPFRREAVSGGVEVPNLLNES